jgi:recombinational DNA repair ATPase RecF
VWIDEGISRMEGAVDDVASEYTRVMHQKSQKMSKNKQNYS